MTLDTTKSEEQIFFTIQQEYKTLAEYKMVAAEKISGVYVIPSFGNSLSWFGVIFVRAGYYAEAVFRFNILLPDRFPQDTALPTIIFQNDIFHPLICPFTGTLDITADFPVWKVGEDHIWQVLKFLQFVFLDPWESLKASPSVLNKEAADLLAQNRAEFIARAKKCAEQSKQQVYNAPTSEDPHYIIFEKFNFETHGPVIEKIKSNNFENDSSPSCSVGLSWVKEGEFKALSLE
ncbi:protein crossbronx [Episyrphus balteatus]|uniref:protein crossbronx n=1 Tax=Episyrphus balteatus TaxID=286459 RepID=UPI0024862764|nr:protein crossbronx [Episyrphus balteatus]